MRVVGDFLVVVLLLRFSAAVVGAQTIEFAADKRHLRLRQDGATQQRVGGREWSDNLDSEDGHLREWLSGYEMEGSMPPIPTPQPSHQAPPTLSPLPASEQPQDLPTNSPIELTEKPSIAPASPNPTHGPTPTRTSPSEEPTERPSSFVSTPTRRPTLLPTTPLPPITLIPVRRPTVSPTKEPSTEITLMETISQRPELETFQVAITAAGLNELLDSNDGVSTVFGPPNSAFQVIEPEYLSQLLTPPYNLQLATLVSYHILRGLALPSADLFDGRVLTMFNQLNITVSRNAPGVFPEIQLVTAPVEEGKTPLINLTEVVDVTATNGVLHEVDSVIFPDWYFYNSLVEVILSMPDTYGTLLAIIEELGIERNITGLPSSTLFGPSNQAFANLPTATTNFLQLPENFDITRQIIEYHILLELVPFTELPEGDSRFVTLQGESVTVNKSTSSSSIISVNGVSVQAFWLGRNEIVYEIDGILIPPSLLQIVPSA